MKELFKDYVKIKRDESWEKDPSKRFLSFWNHYYWTNFRKAGDLKKSNLIKLIKNSKWEEFLTDKKLYNQLIDYLKEKGIRVK